MGDPGRRLVGGDAERGLVAVVGPQEAVDDDVGAFRNVIQINSGRRKQPDQRSPDLGRNFPEQAARDNHAFLTAVDGHQPV